MLVFLADIVVFFGKLLPIVCVELVVSVYNMFNKYFLLKLAKLFLLMPNAPILRELLFLRLLLTFVAKLLSFVVFVLFSNHSSARPVHNSHQGFLVSAEVDLIRRQDCLKAFLLVLLIFLSCKFAHLVDGSFFVDITEDAHVLP